MNKKVFLFSTLAFVASIGATIAINNGNIMFPIIADDQCEHEGFHYHQVDPTIEKAGHREYWVCCKCHESFLEAPIQGKFTDQDDASMINYEITNPAHLPVLNDTNYDLVEQSHVRDGVYKWENLTFTTKGQEDKLTFNAIKNKENDNFGYSGNFNDSIKLGTQSFCLNEWNETYTTQKATVSWTNDATDRTLKIALKGTQDVIASTDGALNLCTNYKQTIIDGSGTLNVKVTQKSSALDASNLTVAKGVTLNLIHNGNRGENGLLAKGNIVFDGDVTFDNFQTAIYGIGNSNITINKDSKLSVLETCKHGFHSEKEKFVVTIYGVCDLRMEYTGFVFSNATDSCELSVLGDGKLNILSKLGWGIHGSSESNSKSLSTPILNFKDNSTVEIHTLGVQRPSDSNPDVQEDPCPIWRYRELNVTDNAKVSLISNSRYAAVTATYSDNANIPFKTLINSSKRMDIISENSKGTRALYIAGKYADTQFSSYLNFENFTVSCIYFRNAVTKKDTSLSILTDSASFSKTSGGVLFEYEGSVTQDIKNDTSNPKIVNKHD